MPPPFCRPEDYRVWAAFQSFLKTVFQFSFFYAPNSLFVFLFIKSLFGASFEIHFFCSFLPLILSMSGGCVVLLDAGSRDSTALHYQSATNPTRFQNCLIFPLRPKLGGETGGWHDSWAKVKMNCWLLILLVGPLHTAPNQEILAHLTVNFWSESY